MTDPFWTKNIKVLFAHERLLEFWPSHQLSFYEQANASTRFLVYSGILLSIANKNSIYFLFTCLLIILLAIIVHKSPMRNHSSGKTGVFPENQKMIQKKCTAPTDENPFANVLMNEYQDNPQRAPACDNDTVSETINDKFFHDFNQDPFDVFNRKHSQRQFFSTANTSIPNDQTSFAHWLYGQKGKTCKENALRCKGNEAFG